MVKRWHGLDFFTMNDLFNKMFGKDALSYEFDKGLKWVVISPDCLPIYQYDHELGGQLFPTVVTSFTSFLEQPQSPQAIPASSPASSNTGQSAALPQASHQAPPLALQIPVASLRPVSQWILKLPLFINHQNLCLFMIYQFVLQMIVPEANLLPLIFRL